MIRTLADIVGALMPAHGPRTAVRYDDGATYHALTFADVVQNIGAALNLMPNDGDQEVVCTFVKNRPEWDMMALAALYSGNILFPLDVQMSDAELAHLLRQSPPDVVLVSTATRTRMRRVLADLGFSPRILIADLYHTFEDTGAPPLEPLQPCEHRLSDTPRPAGRALPPSSGRLDDADLVVAHYATSGTTSLPKVVRITHGNVIAQVNEGRDVMNLRPNEDVLNIGAYTHIATLLEFLVTKANGFCVTYCTREVDDDGVLELEIKTLKRLGVRIKALVAPPKFWIFLMKEVLEEMKDKPIWQRLYLHLTSIEKHAQLVDISTLDKAKLNAVRIYLRNKMGGYFTYGVSSSTRIDPGVVEIMARLGVTVIDIYGATEASGIIARNRLNLNKRGSCGQLIAGVEYRIANPRLLPGMQNPVGELWIKGPTIARGYAGHADNEHLDENGFYHSGDLAWVDDERWVFLIGREKELIAWGDGSLIDRMNLSNLLVRSIWVKDALVTRLGVAETLSVFILPDWKRLEKDREYQAEVAAGVTPAQALRRRLLEAVAFADALAGTTPRLATEPIYLLQRKLQRTPTHKIKFVAELQRLDLSQFV